MEQIGTIAGNATARYIGIVGSLLMPSEALWQKAVSRMQPPLMRELQMTPFTTASEPSGVMIAWAAGYVVVVLMLALHWFRKRAL